MARTSKGFDGARLRAARIDREWSQHELARRSGVAQPSISLFERGRSEPEPATLLALAHALSVVPADLLAPVDGPPTLARRRIEAGLTQRQVADALSIPISTYSAAERGLIAMPSQLASRLDRLLPAAPSRR